MQIKNIIVIAILCTVISYLPVMAEENIDSRSSSTVSADPSDTITTKKEVTTKSIAENEAIQGIIEDLNNKSKKLIEPLREVLAFKQNHYSSITKFVNSLRNKSGFFPEMKAENLQARKLDIAELVHEEQSSLSSWKGIIRKDVEKAKKLEDKKNNVIKKEMSEKQKQQEEKELEAIITRKAHQKVGISFYEFGDRYFFGQVMMTAKLDYIEAVKKYLIAFHNNHSGAANRLGVMYRDGVHFNKDYEKSMHLFKKAIEFDPSNDEAFYNLAQLQEAIYLEDPSQKDMLLGAQAIYTQIGAKGYPEAKNRLAILQLMSGDQSYQSRGIGLFKGLTTKASSEEQQKLKSKIFKTQFSKTLAAAKNNLAIAKFNGLGTDQNIEEAEQLFKEASQNGDPRAPYFLHLLGKMPEQNVFQRYKSFRFLRLAARRGDPVAQNALGVIYLRLSARSNTIGLGLPFHLLGLNWVYESASQGYPEAMYNLAINYFRMPKDSPKAVYLLEMAAKLDFLPALDLLGWVYMHGLAGKDQDIKKGFEYFTSAYKKGYVGGAESLAIFHYDEAQKKGISKNKKLSEYKKSLKWIEKAYNNNVLNAGYYQYLIHMDESTSLYDETKAEKIKEALISKDYTPNNNSKAKESLSKLYDSEINLRNPCRQSFSF